jgi:hypothetical protein
VQVLATVNRVGVTPLTDLLRGLPTAEERLSTSFGGWETLTNSSAARRAR